LKDIIHFDSVIAPSSSMALEDITDVIENLEWIRLVRNKGRLILFKFKTEDKSNQ
jgi:hypothetical protein